MSAAKATPSPSVVALSPRTITAASYKIPDALQQLLHKIEEQRTVNPPASEDLNSLRTDLENRWHTASSQGHTSSTSLYEILEYGWKEWRRIAA